MKKVEFRSLAVEDLEGAVDFYLSEAPHVVERFETAVGEAVSLIARAPGVGSAGLAEVLDIEGLRFLVVDGFPYAIFYVEFGSEIRVLRILHQHRDLANLPGLGG